MPLAASSTELRQIVDRRAMLVAALTAGTVFLLLNLFLVPSLVGGNAWGIVRLIASVPMGREILPPPSTYDGRILLAALGTHYVLSFAFALVVTLVLHRWGIVVGLLGGALLGFAFYCINVYTVTLIFPWFINLRGWPFVLTHCIFGALCGGIYELLEEEQFEEVDEESAWEVLP